MVGGAAARHSVPGASLAEVGAGLRHLQDHVNGGEHGARALGLQVDAPVGARRHVRRQRLDEVVQLLAFKSYARVLKGGTGFREYYEFEIMNTADESGEEREKGGVQRYVCPKAYKRNA